MSNELEAAIAEERKALVEYCGRNLFGYAEKATAAWLRYCNAVVATEKARESAPPVVGPENFEKKSERDIRGPHEFDAKERDRAAKAEPPKAGDGRERKRCEGAVNNYFVESDGVVFNVDCRGARPTSTIMTIKNTTDFHSTVASCGQEVLDYTGPVYAHEPPLSTKPAEPDLGKWWKMRNPYYVYPDQAWCFRNGIVLWRCDAQDTPVPGYSYSVDTMRSAIAYGELVPAEEPIILESAERPDTELGEAQYFSKAFRGELEKIADTLKLPGSPSLLEMNEHVHEAIAAKDTEIGRLNNMINNQREVAELSYDSIKQDRDTALATVAAKDAEIARLKDRLELCRKRISGLDSELTAAKNSIADMR